VTSTLNPVLGVDDGDRIKIIGRCHRIKKILTLLFFCPNRNISTTSLTPSVGLYSFKIMVQRFSLIFAIAGLASQAQLASGFMPISGKAVISNTIVFSSEYEKPEDMQNNQNPAEDVPGTPQFETPAEIPQQPAASQPRPLDPLMAS
jgi:hypothetical protein